MLNFPFNQSKVDEPMHSLQNILLKNSSSSYLQNNFSNLDFNNNQPMTRMYLLFYRIWKNTYPSYFIPHLYKKIDTNLAYYFSVKILVLNSGFGRSCPFELNTYYGFKLKKDFLRFLQKIFTFILWSFWKWWRKLDPF